MSTIKKVVKTAFGGYKIPSENIEEQYTHVIYDKETHEKTLNEIKAVRSQIIQIQENAKKKYKELEKTTTQNIKEVQNEKNRKISEMKEKIREQEQKINELENINKNLIRITRERANSARKLIPKKEHTGYIILSAYQCFLNYKDINNKRANPKKLEYWKIKLQTPYNTFIDASAAKALISDDFSKKLREKMQLDYFLVTNYLDKANEQEVTELWESGENFIFKTQLLANFQKGYWEIECFTRDMINIPNEMLSNI